MPGNGVDDDCDGAIDEGVAAAGRTGQITNVQTVEVNGLEAQKVTLLMKENNQSSGGATPTSAATASPVVLGHW